MDGPLSQEKGFCFPFSGKQCYNPRQKRKKQMKITFTWIPVLMMLLLGAFPGHAAGWQMKDMGVGIFDDAAYDRELRIVEKRASNTWSIKELYERGAFRGNGKIFGVWLVGPPVSAYLDKNGLAQYDYKVRLTDPKGNSVVYGPYGFYPPGHATSFINAGIPGKWRADFMIRQRDTKGDAPIGAIEFTITD
jgi:hypothetical protein